MAFKNDLEFGEWAERALNPHIERNIKNNEYSLQFHHYRHEITKKKSELKDYDIAYQLIRKTDKKDYYGKNITEVVEGKRITFEIKADRYNSETNNLMFEIKCNNKKSGLGYTKADYFVLWTPLYLKDNLWIMKSQDLLKLLETRFSHTLCYGGDGNRSYMFKVHKDDLKQLFRDNNGMIYDYNIPLPEDMVTFSQKDKVLFYATKEKDYYNPIDFLFDKKELVNNNER